MRTIVFSIAILASGCDGAAPELGATSEALHDNNNPRVLPLAGDLHTHDPSLVQDHNGDWYVFSTGDPVVAGGTIQIRRSHDLLHWAYAGNVFDAIPAWATAAIPGVSNLWAPEVHEHDGTYYLYYAASTPGSNNSAIGLATNTTLDPHRPDYHWVDRGLVTRTSFAND